MPSSTRAIPEGISTGAAFERWRREAEARDPKLLWLTERDIAASDAVLEAERFPDHLSAGPLVVQLRYRFEPGHEDDGVSAIVPLHVLNQLPEEPFGWLVPALFEEKVTALVRSLPKQLRVHFVPVPDAVARVLPLLEPGRGSLHAQLADALSRTGGVRVPRDAFREDAAAAAPADELPARRRSRRGDRAIAQPRQPARAARRRLAAALRAAVAAHDRRAQLGVRRPAGAAGGVRGWTPPGRLSGARRRRRQRRPARLRDAARGAREPRARLRAADPAR